MLLTSPYIAVRIWTVGETLCGYKLKYALYIYTYTHTSLVTEVDICRSIGGKNGNVTDTFESDAAGFTW